MAEADPASGGLLASLRRIAGSLFALLQTRAELFTVELQEEKLRAINLLMWLTIALALGVAGILMTAAIVGFFIWEKAGYLGVTGFAVALLAGAAGLLLMLRRRILHGEPPFATTIAEIGKDLSCLRARE